MKNRSLALLAALSLLACEGTESSRVVETETVDSYQTAYSGPKAAI